MVLIANKKGVFFTLLALMIVTILVTTYVFTAQLQKTTSTKKRVETINSFIESTEKDLARQAYIAGFRATLSMLNYVAQYGTPIPSVEAVVEEALLNGTILGQEEPLLIGATFPEIRQVIEERAGKQGINITLSDPIVSVSHTEPWHLSVELVTDIAISDIAEIAYWNRTGTSIVAHIPITYFEDPLYIVSTNGVSTNKIKKSPYEIFVQGTNIQNLSDHALNSYYINSSLSPSFIMRLEGINSPDPNGVESLVNLQELSSQGISVQDKSVVDYIYFSSQNPSSSRVAGMPSWFKLDAEHLAIYNATHLAV